MMDTSLSQTKNAHKLRMRRFVKLCGDTLNAELPLFVMFVQNDDDDGTMFAPSIRRYRTKKLICKIRRLAATAVDDSPHRFWLLKPDEGSRFHEVCKSTVESTCKLFQLESPSSKPLRNGGLLNVRRGSIAVQRMNSENAGFNGINRFRQYCEQYVRVEFNERSMVHLQLYKKLRLKHSFLYVPLESYSQVQNHVKVLMYIQIFEALGAKRIVYRKQTNDRVDSTTEVGVQVHGVDATVAHGSHEMNSSSTSREMTYEKNTHFSFRIRDVLNLLNVHPRCYFTFQEYHGDVELQYVVTSRIKEFMTNYSRFFHCSHAVSTEVKMQLCMATLNQNVGLHTNVQKSDLSDDVFHVQVEFHTVAELCDANEVPTNLSGFSLLTRMIASDDADTDFLTNNTKSFYERFIRERGGDIMFALHKSRLESDDSYRLKFDVIQSFYDVRMLLDILNDLEYSTDDERVKSVEIWT
jgi:hypothetical protein